MRKGGALAELTWLDLTATDRDKVRRVLDLFKEQGTVDELGLGSLRDLFSNLLFPGPSLLHTGLQNVLFLPWLYQQIEFWVIGCDFAYKAMFEKASVITSGYPWH